VAQENLGHDKEETQGVSNCENAEMHSSNAEKYFNKNAEINDHYQWMNQTETSLLARINYTVKYKIYHSTFIG